MITDVSQLLGKDDVNNCKWIKVLDEEAEAIVRSIEGENLKRANNGKTHVGLRAYRDRGYICVHDMGGVAEVHPLDVVTSK